MNVVWFASAIDGAEASIIIMKMLFRTIELIVNRKWEAGGLNLLPAAARWIISNGRSFGPVSGVGCRWQPNKSVNYFMLFCFHLIHMPQPLLVMLSVIRVSNNACLWYGGMIINCFSFARIIIRHTPWPTQMNARRISWADDITRQTHLLRNATWGSQKYMRPMRMYVNDRHPKVRDPSIN